MPLSCPREMRVVSSVIDEARRRGSHAQTYLPLAHAPHVVACRLEALEDRGRLGLALGLAAQLEGGWMDVSGLGMCEGSCARDELTFSAMRHCPGAAFCAQRATRLTIGPK